MHNVEPELHRNTPTVTVIDNRGLNIREIVYHRHPDTPQRVEERITYHQHDARGFLARSADPRLANAGRVNFSYLSDLGGGTLRTRSVDAGGSVALNDVAGRPCLAVSQIGIDAQGCDDASQAVTRTWFYENGASGRLLGVTEQAAGQSSRIMERCVWAGLAQEARDLNLAGQRIRHYDPAGMVEVESIALSGKPHTVTRRLLKGTDEWEVVADWQGAGAADWDALLDTDAYTSVNTADATGAVLTTLDAVCNLQRVSYDVAGQLNGSWLTLENGLERTIVKSLEYSATGQKLREEHGNGVVTHYTYEPATQRLASIQTERPAGRASGAKVLQDLRYAFDPVGNVLNVRNDAEATRFWRNQKVVPQSTYTYDTLYQLASASGREMASAGQQGQGGQFSPFTPIDSATFTRYTRTYTYDSAGNLIRIRHSAPATNNSYTNDITVSDCSNRAVSSTLEPDPSQVEALFTPGGQQGLLLPGQRLAWTPRAELRHVTLVARQGGMDDGESYRYDSDSQRVMKVSIQQASGSAQVRRVMYLPGLERRTVTTNGNITENLHVVTAGEAGRAQVRVLHWETGRPAELANDRLRYSYDDMLGSSTLEVDGAGNVITREEYYPFGGTAVWAARNEVEAHYKTVRYSGKERDATGLYYYGYRYYQPWVGRWLSADPAGTVDGLNLYRMCRNNPMSLVDEYGMIPIWPFDRWLQSRSQSAQPATGASQLRSALNLSPEQNLNMERRAHTAESVTATSEQGASNYLFTLGARQNVGLSLYYPSTRTGIVMHFNHDHFPYIGAAIERAFQALDPARIDPFGPHFQPSEVRAVMIGGEWLTGPNIGEPIRSLLHQRGVGVQWRHWSFASITSRNYGMRLDLESGDTYVFTHREGLGDSDSRIMVPARYLQAQNVGDQAAPTRMVDLTARQRAAEQRRAAARAVQEDILRAREAAALQAVREGQSIPFKVVARRAG